MVVSTNRPRAALTAGATAREEGSPMHDETYNAGRATTAETTAETTAAASQLAMDIDDAVGLDLSPRLRYAGSQDRETLGGMGAQDRATGRTEGELLAGDSEDGSEEPQLDRSQGVGENHSRPREEMPKLSAISLVWEEMDSDELRSLFPDLRCFGIGWGEPFCFRCGWLAPSPEAADYPQTWKAERAINAAWDAATGWLERAHLHDHRFGGEEDALNLVPLCPLCHEQQPFCRTREEGIAFVNEGADVPEVMRAAVQMFTDTLCRDIRRPGKEKALRSLLRARSFVATELARQREGGSGGSDRRQT